MRSDFNSHFNVERVTLEKLSLAWSAKVSATYLHQLNRLSAVHRDHPLRVAEFHEELSPVFNDMLLTMTSYLLSLRDEKKTIEVSVPATWRDHLKDDLLNSGVGWKVWLAQWFAPPQYVTKSEEYAEMRVCPHDNSHFSGNIKHVEWLRGDDDRLA